ncbi:MAG TPA: DEAD/DEAH box helicase, partial [Candidatus Melainabacteria bacterium]|nr:DEAD/DEAH box helicase [Candidatus Melainabacteria bacterium]
TDRAYRIGQDKPVFVYKLIARGTLEERIIELQKQKGELARDILDFGKRRAAGGLTQDDLDLLLAPAGSVH